MCKNNKGFIARFKVKNIEQRPKKFNFAYLFIKIKQNKKFWLSA